MNSAKIAVGLAPDWAEEIAYALHMTGCHYDYSEKQYVTDIATALRKAKADGMREAAKVIEEMQTNNVGMVHPIAIAEAKALHAAADKIEKGEP